VKNIYSLLILTAFFSVSAIPPPPGIFDIPSREHITWLDSYRDAVSRGVDTPNEIYGSGNPIAQALGSEPMNVLILLVDFSDKVSQAPAAYFDSMGFAQDTFSLTSYYNEVSFGRIDIVTVDWPGDVEWSRAPETYAYYVNDNYGWGAYPRNSQGLVEAVCTIVDPVVDFSKYDNDGDGLVDGVNLIYAGQFDGTPQMIWPHAWALGNPLTVDGVEVYTFSVQNEFKYNPGDKSANTICHEFGHILGLPDLYDLDYDSKGIGNWGLMSFGVFNGGGWSPAEFCPYCRSELGILDLIEITQPGMYQIPAIELSNTAYRIWTGGDSGYQYFILENRRQIGLDEALPSEGVMIWHVDKYMTSNNNQWYPGHTDEGHYLVALEQADGLWQLEKNTERGDSGDPYPGSSSNTEFTYWTVPDSRNYLGEDTQVYVSSIPASADTVEVFISSTYTGIEQGNDHAENLLTVSGVTIEVKHSGGTADISVLDIAGRRVATIHEGVMNSGTYTFQWDTGEVPVGLYFVNYRWESDSESVPLMAI